MGKGNFAETVLHLQLEERERMEILKKYHFEDKHERECKLVYEELIDAMEVVSNLTRVNGETKERLSFVDKANYLIGMITLGEGVDGLLQKYYHANRVFEAYMADCLCMELLRSGYEQFESFVYEECGEWPEKYDFIGDNYPIESILEIIKYVPQDIITHNQAYALIPSKSVVFLSTLSPQKKDCMLQICENCKNTMCEKQKMRPQNYGEMQIFRRRNYPW
ncbi:MAG: hypothetical protein ACERKN_09250 [Velocimicrobium sp.]